ncbi:MAG: hypothetical protein HOP16_13880 [Acidobacteria bacterium]|nr:hypothetical protein [Acidobacteriota bacterium]
MPSLLALCCAIAYVSAASEASQATPTASQKLEYASGTCESALEQYCSGPEYKSWTASEISEVDDAIADISATVNGRTVILQARVPKLRRKSNDAANPTANGISIVGDGFKFIALTDRFFEHSGLRDRWSGAPGYRLQTRILLHEIFHALDEGGRFSEQNAEFLALVGYRLGADNSLALPVTRDLALLFGEINGLRQKGEHAKAWDLERRIGRMLSETLFPTLLPSVGAFVGPKDGFAEIGAHLVLDPTARQYLNPRVVEYFDRTLFTETAR